MASLYVKDGIIYLQWSELLPSGRRKRFQVSTRMRDNPGNQRKAEIIKTEKEAELKQPKKVLSYHYPLRSACKEFLVHKKNYSKRTVERLQDSVNAFLEINGELFCAEVTEEHVEAYRETMSSLAVNTVAAHFSLMHSFFNWLKFKRYIRENPFYYVKKTARKIIPIPEDLFETIISKCNNETQKLILRFLWLTGFRKGEALSLRWEEIDWTNKTIYVSNTKADRRDEFPLYPEVEKLLQPHRKPRGKVFGYSDGSTLEFWYNIKKKLGHDFIIHDIRKTFACSLVDNGASIYHVKELMRHVSVATTEKYYARSKKKTLGEVAQNTFKKKPKVFPIQKQA